MCVAGLRVEWFSRGGTTGGVCRQTPMRGRGRPAARGDGMGEEKEKNEGSQSGGWRKAALGRWREVVKNYLIREASKPGSLRWTGNVWYPPALIERRGQRLGQGFPRCIAHSRIGQISFLMVQDGQPKVGWSE
eukprot:GGOE01046675.1.p2 GENE.GGOE01046675.1~~GGOE01046675.1.p2  ORF type:complete len:133 (-),score=0.82 GGOE01046675.1:475-873(-)